MPAIGQARLRPVACGSMASRPLGFAALRLLFGLGVYDQITSGIMSSRLTSASLPRRRPAAMALPAAARCWRARASSACLIRWPCSRPCRSSLPLACFCGGLSREPVHELRPHLAASSARKSRDVRRPRCGSWRSLGVGPPHRATALVLPRRTPGTCQWVGCDLALAFTAPGAEVHWAANCDFR